MGSVVRGVGGRRGAAGIIPRGGVAAAATRSSTRARISKKTSSHACFVRMHATSGYRGPTPGAGSGGKSPACACRRPR